MKKTRKTDHSIAVVNPTDDGMRASQYKTVSSKDAPVASQNPCKVSQGQMSAFLLASFGLCGHFLLVMLA